MKDNFIYDPSLILYLPLWQLDGTVVQSKDAYGHTCTKTDVPWGLQGGTFNGTSSLINCGINSALTLTSSQTVIVWAKSNSTAEQWIYRRDLSGSYFAIRCFGNKFNVFETGAGGWDTGAGSGTATINNNAFHHLAVSFTPSVNAINYVDSVVDGSDITVGTGGTGTLTSAIIGREGVATNTWNGLIGEVMIYNRALNPMEIQRNYLATKYRYQ